MEVSLRKATFKVSAHGLPLKQPPPESLADLRSDETNTKLWKDSSELMWRTKGLGDTLQDLDNTPQDRNLKKGTVAATEVELPANLYWPKVDAVGKFGNDGQPDEIEAATKPGAGEFDGMEVGFRRKGDLHEYRSRKGHEVLKVVHDTRRETITVLQISSE